MSRTSHAGEERLWEHGGAGFHEQSLYLQAEYIRCVSDKGSRSQNGMLGSAVASSFKVM